MISVDRLILYKTDMGYKFAIKNKDESKLALVIDDVILEKYDPNLVFSFSYLAGNGIDDEWVVSTESFRDFLHLVLVNDRNSIVSIPKCTLPNRKSCEFLKERIPCCGIYLEKEELSKIEKFLNKKVFKKNDKQKSKSEDSYLNF